MKTTQRWIYRSIICLSSLSLLLAITLIFPHILSTTTRGGGKYLAQIHVSKEASLQIYNATGKMPSMIYEINLLQYCEYNVINNTVYYSNSSSLLRKSPFYPTPGSRSAKLKELFSLASQKPVLREQSIDLSSYKCNWALPTLQAFDLVQIFGLPSGYSMDQLPDVYPADLFIHYLKLAKYSKILPILILCYSVFQFYIIWVSKLKLAARRQITVYTMSPSQHLRHLDDSFVFSCIASLLLLIMIILMDTSRDQHLFEVISEYYSSSQSPIYVFPKSACFSNVLTWMVEISILLIPISLASRFH